MTKLLWGEGGGEESVGSRKQAGWGGFGYAPSSNEVTALEVFDKRLWSCQADQEVRVKITTDTTFGRALLDIPR